MNNINNIFDNLIFQHKLGACDDGLRLPSRFVLSVTMGTCNVLVLVLVISKLHGGLWGPGALGSWRLAQEFMGHVGGVQSTPTVLKLQCQGCEYEQRESCTSRDLECCLAFLWE